MSEPGGFGTPTLSGAMTEHLNELVHPPTLTMRGGALELSAQEYLLANNKAVAAVVGIDAVERLARLEGTRGWPSLVARGTRPNGD